MRTLPSFSSEDARVRRDGRTRTSKSNGRIYLTFSQRIHAPDLINLADTKQISRDLAPASRSQDLGTPRWQNRSSLCLVCVGNRTIFQRMLPTPRGVVGSWSSI